MLLDRAAGLAAGARRPVRRLLVLLDEVAAATAASRRQVDEAVALEVVPRADVGLLHGHQAGGRADAGRAAEEEAL